MVASMMITNSNAFLLIFSVAFMGCVLATPMVTRIAVWAGAIDRPDQFRRIHKGATPRLGGLGLAFGILVGVVVVVQGGYFDHWETLPDWSRAQWSVLAASLLVLVIGVFDDTLSMGPRVKLLGQTLAALLLYAGGMRISNVEILGWSLDLTQPAIPLEALGYHKALALPGLAVTTFWFLACMNIWNLIDGMDGLASGVGLLVSGTLTLVAIYNDNIGVAITASALAGSLAGFLLYNWHPACIFLGDSGSLLIGLLIGVIGVQGQFKGPSAISILFPILAMGLPISDTALAIFRRWVRNLPLSSADRRHVHHLLISLGLSPRLAAIVLYIFTFFLCGVVLLGVVKRNEQLALILGISGSLAFLLILTSRLNELSSLRGDFQARLVRGRQERFAAKATWEAIQRIEMSKNLDEVKEILDKTARALGCDLVRISCAKDGFPLYGEWGHGSEDELELEPAVTGPAATFRLSSGRDLALNVSLHLRADSPLAADIAFRFLQKLSVATTEHLERLMEELPADEVEKDEAPELFTDTRSGPSVPGGVRELAVVKLPELWSVRAFVMGFRVALGLGPRSAGPPSIGKEQGIVG
jgi:UDP-GlcNAc:undecaprenyl-phosphate GlcNAc-1-phosphate transferase